jgi:hypothetical protein
VSSYGNESSEPLYLPTLLRRRNPPLILVRPYSWLAWMGALPIAHNCFGRNDLHGAHSSWHRQISDGRLLIVLLEVGSRRAIYRGYQLLYAWPAP